MLPPEKESPISISSYSESPMSEEPEHPAMYLGEVDLELEEENISKPAVTELEISLSDTEDVQPEVDVDLRVTDETKPRDNQDEVNDLDVNNDGSYSNDVGGNDTNLDVLENDTSYEEIISAVEDMVKPDEIVVVVEHSDQIDPEVIDEKEVIDEEEVIDQTEETVELPRTPEIVVTDPITFDNGVVDEPVENRSDVSFEEVETSPAEEKAESIEPGEVEEKLAFAEEKFGEKEEKPDVMEERVETVEEKENHPQMVRTLSNNG